MGIGECSCCKAGIYHTDRYFMQNDGNMVCMTCLHAGRLGVAEGSVKGGEQLCKDTPKMTLADMTREARSLLLYMETQAVDHGGLVDCRYINVSDRCIVESWDRDGFVTWDRLSSDDVAKQAESNSTRQVAYVVGFSDHAWSLAHEERRARCARILSKRTWKTTKEVRDEGSTIV